MDDVAPGESGTEAPTATTEQESVTATCIDCGDTYEVAFRSSALGSGLYARTGEAAGSVGPEDVDMVFTPTFEWYCNRCLS